MARHETGWFARASRERARGRIAILLGNVRLAAGVTSTGARQRRENPELSRSTAQQGPRASDLSFPCTVMRTALPLDLSMPLAQSSLTPQSHRQSFSQGVTESGARKEMEA